METHSIYLKVIRPKQPDLRKLARALLALLEEKEGRATDDDLVNRQRQRALGHPPARKVAS